MNQEPIITVSQDIYDDNGVLLISKGREFILTNEKRKILSKCGR